MSVLKSRSLAAYPNSSDCIRAAISLCPAGALTELHPTRFSPRSLRRAQQGLGLHLALCFLHKRPYFKALGVELSVRLPPLLARGSDTQRRSPELPAPKPLKGKDTLQAPITSFPSPRHPPIAHTLLIMPNRSQKNKQKANKSPLPTAKSLLQELRPKFSALTSDFCPAQHLSPCFTPVPLKGELLPSGL